MRIDLALKVLHQIFIIFNAVFIYVEPQNLIELEEQKQRMEYLISDAWAA